MKGTKRPSTTSGPNSPTCFRGGHISAHHGPRRNGGCQTALTLDSNWMMMPMANDLTNPNEELLALRRNAARYRIGELPGERIAFKKGAWLRGTRKLPIPEDERFVVALLESLHGWLKWKNQRPQFVLGRVSDPSWVPPDRDEL